MTVTMECEVPGCGKSFTAETEENALARLSLHDKQVHSSSTGKQKTPKLDRPRLSRGTSPEEFETWSKMYELWKRSTDISENELTGQLLSCCDSDLKSSLIQFYSDIKTISEPVLLSRIKVLAVLDISASVRVLDTLNMKRQPYETARTFVARLRGSAKTCPFQMKCGATEPRKEERTTCIDTRRLSPGIVLNELYFSYCIWV